MCDVCVRNPRLPSRCQSALNVGDLGHFRLHPLVRLVNGLQARVVALRRPRLRKLGLDSLLIDAACFYSGAIAVLDLISRCRQGTALFLQGSQPLNKLGDLQVCESEGRCEVACASVLAPGL